MREKSGIAARREELRKQYWPNEDLWTGEKEKGWFPAPRTLPLILALLSSKHISPKNNDPSSVYLELMSHQRGEGIVEIGHEADHAFAAGYWGPRGVRTWQERIKILEDNGFILTKPVGNRLKFIAIVHPTTAVQKLRDRGKISDNWWNAYIALKAETKEPTYEQRQKKKEADQKIVDMMNRRRKVDIAKNAQNK